MLDDEAHQKRAASLPLAEIDVSDPALYQHETWRPYFQRLRNEAPVHYCRESAYGLFWSVSSSAHIMEVELNPGVFSSKAELGGIQLDDISQEHDRPAFVSMDPPEHTGPRRALAYRQGRQGRDVVCLRQCR